MTAIRKLIPTVSLLALFAAPAVAADLDGHQALESGRAMAVVVSEPAGDPTEEFLRSVEETLEALGNAMQGFNRAMASEDLGMAERYLDEGLAALEKHYGRFKPIYHDAKAGVICLPLIAARADLYFLRATVRLERGLVPSALADHLMVIQIFEGFDKTLENGRKHTEPAVREVAKKIAVSFKKTAGLSYAVVGMALQGSDDSDLWDRGRKYLEIAAKLLGSPVDGAVQ